jgi:hypothetical protein
MINNEKTPYNERSYLFMKGHPCVGIYTTLILSCTIYHSYSYSYIHLFKYPYGFLCTIPYILDVCSLNQIGSCYIWYQRKSDPSLWLPGTWSNFRFPWQRHCRPLATKIFKVLGTSGL